MQHRIFQLLQHFSCIADYFINCI